MPLPNRPYCRDCLQKLQKADREEYEIRKGNILTQAELLEWSKEEADHAVEKGVQKDTLQILRG